jgi:hypothetical protein
VPVSRAPIVLALAMGCGAESGIIAEIHIDPANSEPPHIEDLDFAVGITVDRRSYQTDLDSFGDRADVGDRDLRWEPFRLLVRDEVDVEGALVMVGVVGYGDDGAPVAVGRFPQPIAFVDGEVRLYPLELVPLGSQDDIRVIGECFIWTDALGRRHALGDPPDDDRDCDGDPDSIDCGPDDPSVGPTANELCDDDGANSDCDPNNNPASAEVCNGRDDDCDSLCDDGYDLDGDGYTTCGYLTTDGCIEDPLMFDCHDVPGIGAQVNPGEVEICDGLDNDCLNGCDDTFDEDEDGFTTCGSIDPVTEICTIGPPDCAPFDDEVYPGAVIPCYTASDGCSTGTTQCVSNGVDDYVWDVCTIHAGSVQVPVELCNDYATCLTQPEAYWDCWDRVNESLEALALKCPWPFVGETPCPGPADLLTTAGVECTFYLVPETAETVTVTIGVRNTCTGTLNVTAATSTLSDIITVITSSGGVLDHFFVKVEPFPVTDCPAPSAILCTPP